MTKKIPLLLFAFALFSPVTLTAQSAVRVRIMPPNQAQFLQFQKFDVRIEATAPEGTALGDLRVTLDGRDITSLATVTGSGNAKSWTFRSMYLGIPGARNIGANVALQGSSSSVASAVSNINVRTWQNAEAIGLAKQVNPVEELMAQQPRFSVEGESNDAQLHLGGTVPAFHRVRIDAVDPVQRRAKNVILLIGDGMGVAHRTAGRVLSKGYTQGKANGTMAMDRLPFNGLLMTSSMDSLITDSAPGAHNYSTGNKTNNGMEGVFPDNTAAEDDNPRIENLPEWAHRSLGMVTGVVSDAFITDATPAAMIAHTQNRGNGTMIASQFIDEADKTGLKVLLGGGAYHFIPKSQTGSRRTDERNVVNDFKSAGFDFLETRTQLNAYGAAPNRKLLGLFNLDNMNVAFDKLGLGDPAITSAFPDQPFLAEMTKKAIDVLKQYPNGFFLMVEGAHIDKQAHAMDAERSIYDVIQLDHAVQVALDFALLTNTDSDPNNDTLIIVSADHECAGVTLPGVGNPLYKESARDYVKTYNYSAPRNDPATLNFTNYVDANNDGYPDNPDPDRKLIINFGANSDRFEDWKANWQPKAPSSKVGNIAVANPGDPDKTTGIMIAGVIENGEKGAEGQTSAVHTLSDIPISAYGPGASQFSRVSDNTEAFFYIVNAITGQYAVPTLY
ncbi:MAG TPA: alkaline phosphatase [Thermoanaerobaculia bacterium]|jgi:alkaline phosphatase|nr:alkaline phosphatase [Thermoanaerobaculia bacterium]